MAVIPVGNSGGLNLEEYWQVQALSVDWLYVLDKLRESIKAKPEDAHCMMGVGMGDVTIYFLKKSFYPVAVMAKATGIAEDKLLAYTGIIKLKSKPVDPDLPQPTVPYWGEA